MKLVLANVPGALGEIWEFRLRTSNRDVADTFGPWNDVPTLALDQRLSAEEVENGDELVNAIMVRVPATFAIVVGSRMRLKVGPGPEYHVKEQISSGIGTNRFMLERARRDQIGDLRGGGFSG